MPKLPAIRRKRPRPLRRAACWIKEHSKWGERPAPTAVELAEGVWPRAMRDTKLLSTNTIWAAALLVFCAGVGNHFAQKIHEPHQSPSTAVEIGGPVAGLALGVLLIFLIRLLLTFRVQRNEARRSASSGKPASVGPTVRIKGSEWELTGATGESMTDVLGAAKSAGLGGAREVEADA